MNVTKCDVCKTEIEEKDKLIRVGVGGSFHLFEFCQQCGKPIREFLNQKGFSLKSKFDRV